MVGMELTASEVDDARAGEVVVALYPEPALAVPRPVRHQLQGHEPYIMAAQFLTLTGQITRP